jgi:multimeric flavodoxin WrbA
MKHLLLIHHSQTGSTAALAQAVLDGARDPAIAGVELRVASPLAADAEDLRWADAVILGTPENFGYMSGALKYFFDRIYYTCLEQTQGLPYALFIKAGNDGDGALSSVHRIVTGLRWREVQAPLVVKGDINAQSLIDCRELGMALAAGLEAGLF